MTFKRILNKLYIFYSSTDPLCYLVLPLRGKTVQEQILTCTFLEQIEEVRTKASYPNRLMDPY